MLYRSSASELSSMLQDRKISAEELLQSVLTRIAEKEPQVQAYLAMNASALEQARAIDRARAAGAALPPLAGIPIAVKDNIAVRDMPTTCASRMLENYVSPFNAHAVEKLRSAGMIIIGKTNMDEFAMGSSTETSWFHNTCNPWDPTRVPGGSSGGSAAAVAAGEAVLALGSDTGGSVRQPAAFCGVVGLKPTYGRISRWGLIAFASSLDQIGVMARTVEDAAFLYETIAGHDPKDATSLQSSLPSVREQLGGDVRGLRIGIPKEFFAEGTDAEVSAAIHDALRLLERSGAVLKPIALPETRSAVSAYYLISSAEASSNLARFDGVRYGYRTTEYASLAQMMERSRSEGFGDEVKRRIMLGTFALSAGHYDAYYRRAVAAQERILQELVDVFQEVDCIATPTAPAPAPRFGIHQDDPVKRYRADLCTVTANLAGIPAISIPCGMTAAGLPIGMQLMGAQLQEEVLLRAAYRYEQETGGFPSLWDRTERGQGNGTV